MDSLSYTSTAWEPSQHFHVAEDFDTSLSPVPGWNISYDGAWQFPPNKHPEDAHYIVHDDFEETKPKLDLFPLHIPQDDSPRVCSPAELSPLRSSFSSSPLSTPGLSPSSVSSLPPFRSTSPSSVAYETGQPFTCEAQFNRAQIKKDPEEFIASVFGGADQSQLRDRLREVIGSRWWLNGVKEPRGILNVFVKRLGNRIFECPSCGKRLPRADRAVDHFRVHIQHRPFECKGENDCGVPSCRMAFHTRDCLKSHIFKHEKECDRCHAKVEDKNLNRHRETRKCRRFGLDA